MFKFPKGKDLTCLAHRFIPTWNNAWNIVRLNTICWINESMGERSLGDYSELNGWNTNRCVHLSVPGVCEYDLIWEKTTLQMLITLTFRWDHPRLSVWTPNLMTSVFIRNVQGRFDQRKREKVTAEVEIGVMQIQAKECLQPPGRWKWRGMNSLGLWKEHGPPTHSTDFRLLVSSTVREWIPIVRSHQIYGALLWWPQETNRGSKGWDVAALECVLGRPDRLMVDKVRLCQQTPPFSVCIPSPHQRRAMLVWLRCLKEEAVNSWETCLTLSVAVVTHCMGSHPRSFVNITQLEFWNAEKWNFRESALGRLERISEIALIHR